MRSHGLYSVLSLFRTKLYYNMCSALAVITSFASPTRNMVVAQSAYAIFARLGKKIYRTCQNIPLVTRRIRASHARVCYTTPYDRCALTLPNCQK